MCPQQEGVLALWRGWLPSVIGVIPYVGLNFAVYETSKDAILSHYGAPLF
jgi:solute carrier family 25 phosphate transporter 23/24/25/41